MMASRRPYTLAAVREATARMAERIARAPERRADQIRSDADHARRAAALLCLPCHYIPGIAGQAFTDWECARCGAPGRHHSTAVPALCRACALATGLCPRCMGDRDGREPTGLP